MTSNDPTSLRPMERVEADGLVLTWSPDTRLMKLEASRAVATTASGQGGRLVEAINLWVGDSEESFGFLADNSRVKDADAASRVDWAGCFDAHRELIRVAWIGQSPQMQVMTRMFVTGLRTKGLFIGEAFLEEDEARAWLREQGIDA